MLVGVVGIAAAALAAYLPAHRTDALTAFPIALLILASAFDAFSGSVPLLLLLAGVSAAIAVTTLEHRVPWFGLAVLPFAFAAWRSEENAIGWGDVLGLLILAIALPFWSAIVAIIVGSGLSLIVTFMSNRRAGRMTPFIALGAVAAMWLFG